MSIVRLTKLTLFGPSNRKQTAIDRLQRLGCLHLIPLRSAPSRPLPSESGEARRALRFLETCPVQPRQAVVSEAHDPQQIVNEVLEILTLREDLEAEQDEVREAMGRLQPWGDFVAPNPADADGLRLWFYEFRKRDLDQLSGVDVPWRIVSSDERHEYVVAVARERPRQITAAPVDLGDRSLSQLRRRGRQIAHELEELHWRRVRLTRWRAALEADVNRADDDTARAVASEGSLDDQRVFALQAWAPEAAVDPVLRVAKECGVAVTREPPSPLDEPPTLLKNPEVVAGAEKCVTFYITPDYRAWDPTPIVYFSFSLFIAMIIADAGYGLVLAVIVGLLWRKLAASERGRPFRNLLAGIVVATFVYGVIQGSYFGAAPPRGSPLDHLRVTVDGRPLMEHQNLMMLVAAAVGVAHLALANVIAAWNRRWSVWCLGSLGWAAIMVGGFLLGCRRVFDAGPPDGVAHALLVVGGAAVLLFSSEQPLFSGGPRAHLWRLIDGVAQVRNLPKAFGDVLSYLRLFALGLASAQLAATFNRLASESASASGMGFLLALLILGFGHTINLTLALMGGVVHGLRLNCIEFFNWSLREEGRPFRPFRRKAVA